MASDMASACFGFRVMKEIYVWVLVLPSRLGGVFVLCILYSRFASEERLGYFRVGVFGGSRQEVGVYVYYREFSSRRIRDELR